MSPINDNNLPEGWIVKSFASAPGKKFYFNVNTLMQASTLEEVYDLSRNRNSNIPPHEGFSRSIQQFRNDSGTNLRHSHSDRFSHRNTQSAYYRRSSTRSSSSDRFEYREISDHSRVPKPNSRNDYRSALDSLFPNQNGLGNERNQRPRQSRKRSLSCASSNFDLRGERNEMPNVSEPDSSCDRDCYANHRPPYARMRSTNWENRSFGQRNSSDFQISSNRTYGSDNYGGPSNFSSRGRNDLSHSSRNHESRINNRQSGIQLGQSRDNATLRNRRLGSSQHPSQDFASSRNIKLGFPDDVSPPKKQSSFNQHQSQGNTSTRRKSLDFQHNQSKDHAYPRNRQSIFNHKSQDNASSRNRQLGFLHQNHDDTSPCNRQLIFQGYDDASPRNRQFVTVQRQMDFQRYQNEDKYPRSRYFSGDKSPAFNDNIDNENTAYRCVNDNSNRRLENQNELRRRSDSVSRNCDRNYGSVNNRRTNRYDPTSRPANRSSQYESDTRWNKYKGTRSKSCAPNLSTRSVTFLEDGQYCSPHFSPNRNVLPLKSILKKPNDQVVINSVCQNNNANMRSFADINMRHSTGANVRHSAGQFSLTSSSECRGLKSSADVPSVWDCQNDQLATGQSVFASNSGVMRAVSDTSHYWTERGSHFRPGQPTSSSANRQGENRNRPSSSGQYEESQSKASSSEYAELNYDVGMRFTRHNDDITSRDSTFAPSYDRDEAGGSAPMWTRKKRNFPANHSAVNSLSNEGGLIGHNESRVIAPRASAQMTSPLIGSDEALSANQPIIAPWADPQMQSPLIGSDEALSANQLMIAPWVTARLPSSYLIESNDASSTSQSIIDPWATARMSSPLMGPNVWTNARMPSSFIGCNEAQSESQPLISPWANAQRPSSSIGSNEASSRSRPILVPRTNTLTSSLRPN